MLSSNDPSKCNMTPPDGDFLRHLCKYVCKYLYFFIDITVALSVFLECQQTFFALKTFVAKYQGLSKRSKAFEQSNISTARPKLKSDFLINN